MKISKKNSSGSLKLASIDAIRGWAIFLVIISHTGGAFAELPWRIKAMTNLGWFGVQLFFLASAFTLVMSWRRQEGSYWRKFTKFFIRRFFRIAPMYYFGCLLYFLIRPPLDNFSFEQLAASLVFLNAWSPQYMTTLNDAWQVVPGGWSIGVEFSFYLIFPFLILFVTSLSRSIIFFLLSLVLAFLSYYFGLDYYENIYGYDAAEKFMFFWLPSQLGIFSLGFILYFFSHSQHHVINMLKQVLSKYALFIYLSGVALVLVYAQVGTNKHFSGLFPWLPAHYIVSFVFLLFTVLMLEKDFSILVNPAIVKLGQVSFSAYIIHFSIIQVFHNLELIESTGIISILYFGLVLTLVTVITFVISTLTYNFIELPFVRLGQLLTKKISA
ncbi:MAG: acyltransferase family protein [Methyloprofundus sp.]|nr:acyltransferase family protein [Methyloprofundus sp.]